MLLKQGDLIEVTINSYGSNGEGVALKDEYIVFVPLTIAGETVSVRVTYVKKNICYAQLVKVIEPSQHRVVPKCRYFGKCGGCLLQHMDYEEQLEVKKGIVISNMKKIAGLELSDINVVGSPLQYGYRNKISLPVVGRRGNVVIGMYRSDSHDIVPCDGCDITGSWATELVALMKKFLDSNFIQPYNQRTFKGEIRHIVARYIDNQLLLTLVFNGETKRDFSKLCRLLDEKFSKWGLFVNINALKNNVIMGKTTYHIDGIDSIVSTDVNGVVFRLQPDSFFQVNDKVKDLLYSKARQLIASQGTEALVDCFSGVGLLTCAMCSPSYHTYAIEIVKEASEDAEVMRKLNNIDTLTNICGDVTQELPKVMEQCKGKKTVLLVDPPRKGLGEKICKTITDNMPDKVVYISCDNATLARDLTYLLPYYELKYIELYDLFPHTRHIETLVQLVKR